MQDNLYKSVDEVTVHQARHQRVASAASSSISATTPDTLNGYDETYPGFETLNGRPAQGAQNSNRHQTLMHNF